MLGCGGGGGRKGGENGKDDRRSKTCDPLKGRIMMRDPRNLRIRAQRRASNPSPLACAAPLRARNASALRRPVRLRPASSCAPDLPAHSLGFGSGGPNTVPAVSVPCMPAAAMTTVAPGARICRRPGRRLPADPVTSGQVVCPVAGPPGGGRPCRRNPAAAAAVTPGPHASRTAANPLFVRGVATGLKSAVPSAGDPAGGRAAFCPPTRRLYPPFCPGGKGGRVSCNRTGMIEICLNPG